MEVCMTRLREKAQGHTKQVVGQMIGDDQLVLEGKRQVGEAESERSSAHHSDHGIVKDEKAEEQPKDKERVQTVHKTDANDSVSKEETRNPNPGKVGKKLLQGQEKRKPAI
jgi:uncharacterized protein YjbJ (UPF0337 family)